MALRVRLTAISLAALLPGFIIVAVTQYLSISARHAEVEKLATRSAVLAASELERILDGVTILMNSAAQLPDIREFREPGCSNFASVSLRNDAGLAVLAVLDASGTYRCGSVPQLAGESLADQPYVARALKGGGMAVGEYTVGRLTGRPVLPAALAMRAPSGKPIGVLVGSIDLQWLGQQIKQRGVPPGGSLTIADRDGVIIARQPLFERFIGTRIPAEYMHLVHAPAPGAVTVTSQDGTQRVLGYLPADVPPTGLYVSAGLSVDDSLGAARRTAWLGSILAVGSGLATLVATWVVGDRLFVRPLRGIQAVLDRWRDGDRSARTGMHGVAGEIGALGASLDRLMDEISRMQDHRELLASELVHRVKNILAGVQAIAALSLNKSAPGRELLPDFQARLAALAGTHEILTREHWESAALADVARRVAAPLCGDVDARFTFDGPPLELPARHALGMTMVLHELATNAIKYGALSVPAGRVLLRWSAATCPDGTSVDLLWQEIGGPPVTRPAVLAGFGNRMIQRALGQGAKVTLDFDPAGLQCRISLHIGADPTEGS